MALTDEQRAELETLGPETVRIKLLHGGAGKGASIPGFKTGSFGSGELARGDIEDWLVEKHIQEAHIQKSTLQWAKIAGWAGIAGVIVGLLAVLITVWLAK